MLEKLLEMKRNMKNMFWEYIRYDLNSYFALIMFVLGWGSQARTQRYCRIFEESRQIHSSWCKTTQRSVTQYLSVSSDSHLYKFYLYNI